MNEHELPRLEPEGVVVYTVADREEASHVFEHTLGLTRTGEDGDMLFFAGGGATIAVYVSAGDAPQPPYVVLSTGDTTAAAEHFLHRGFQVRSLPWAPEGGGFLARSPEGHTIAVVDESLLDDGAEP